MPRIRSVRPEIWHLEEFAYCTPMAQNVLIRVMSAADDSGRLLGKLPYLLQCLFPWGKGDRQQLEDALKELAEVGLVKLYTVDQKPYVQVVGWEDDSSPMCQRIKTPRKSAIPAPPDEDGGAGEAPVPHDGGAPSERVEKPFRKPSEKSRKVRGRPSGGRKGRTERTGPDSVRSGTVLSKDRRPAAPPPPAAAGAAAAETPGQDRRLLAQRLRRAYAAHPERSGPIQALIRQEALDDPDWPLEARGLLDEIEGEQVADPPNLSVVA